MTASRLLTIPLAAGLATGCTTQDDTARDTITRTSYDRAESTRYDNANSSSARGNEMNASDRVNGVDRSSARNLPPTWGPAQGQWGDTQDDHMHDAQGRDQEPR